jgi:cytoskeletal protein RodZ
MATQNQGELHICEPTIQETVTTPGPDAARPPGGYAERRVQPSGVEAIMRSVRSEHILLAALLAVPLAVAFLGWPALLQWAVGPSPEPTPEVAGASTTPAGLAAAPTRRPTVGAPATVASRSTALPTVGLAATPTTVATLQAEEPTSTPSPVNMSTSVVRADDPSSAVQDFYARVATHDFGDAAALWSPRMREAFPPTQNIDQRFSGTRALTVQRADVASESGNRAAVAVDLDESTGDGQHHWSGTWYVVRGPDGWLLDQPQLQGR